MKTFTLIAAVACLSTAFSARAEEPAARLKPLFNGRDLSGWHGLGHFDPRKLAEMSESERSEKMAADLEDLHQHWKVVGNEVVNDGHGVYLTSDREYGDIELQLEYKTVAGADSGIYLRGSPQIQIWDTTEAGGKWNLGAAKGSGGLWNNSKGAPGKDPLVHADRPFGQWNHVRVVQVGARTSVWLNDRLVVQHAVMENFWDREKPLFARGPIQLQTHGGEIRWRNLRVRDIQPEEANEILARYGHPGYQSVFNGRDFAGWAGPVDNYEVVDGAIRCKPGSGGTIYTERKYSDFAARLQFRLPPGGNNGLAIRYPGEGNAAYAGMCELQVLDNGAEKYAELDPRQFHGSAYGIAAAQRGYLRPPGTWNFQEVTVEGSRVRVELNGFIILDADLSEVDQYMADSEHPGLQLAEGHFGFAGHADPVEFRDISIHEIATP